jgi:hypothetical protein
VPRIPGQSIRITLLLGSLFLLFGVVPTHASGIEVAPFYGLRFGGNYKNNLTGNSMTLDPSAAIGATINAPLPGLQEKLELLYSHQESQMEGGVVGPDVNVKVDVWQAGLLREYTMYDQFRPFLVGTLGVTNFSYGSPLKDQNLFSIGMGGGFKYHVTPHVGFRLDMRAYVSFVEGSGAVACAGGCVVQYQGSTFIQGEITPSILIVF